MNRPMTIGGVFYTRRLVIVELMNYLTWVSSIELSVSLIFTSCDNKIVL